VTLPSKPRIRALIACPHQANWSAATGSIPRPANVRSLGMVVAVSSLISDDRVVAWPRSWTGEVGNRFGHRRCAETKPCRMRATIMLTRRSQRCRSCLSRRQPQARQRGWIGIGRVSTPSNVVSRGVRLLDHRRVKARLRRSDACCVISPRTTKRRVSSWLKPDDGPPDASRKQETTMATTVNSPNNSTGNEPMRGYSPGSRSSPSNAARTVASFCGGRGRVSILGPDPTM
jgi:hypothetical protein